jgi:hypothetical protein
MGTKNCLFFPLFSFVFLAIKWPAIFRLNPQSGLGFNFHIVRSECTVHVGDTKVAENYLAKTLDAIKLACNVV